MQPGGVPDRRQAVSTAASPIEAKCMIDASTMENDEIVPIKDGNLNVLNTNRGGMEERLIISASMMKVVDYNVSIKIEYRAMIDSGANVNVAPLSLVKTLGLPLMPHTDGRSIGTAKAQGELVIVGWIFPTGYTGPIAIVRDGVFILLSVTQLQQNGMSVQFPSYSNSCILQLKSGDTESVYAEVEQCAPTNLYFIDIRKLLASYMPEYVRQPNDMLMLAQEIYLNDNEAYLANASPVESDKIVPLPGARRKRQPTTDILFRVWRLHERMNHVNLTTLAYMVDKKLLGEAEVTAAEIILVRDHQQCFSCALAKWRALPETTSSGIRPNIIGRTWSMDYKGPYKTKAIGGFTGKFIFVCLACGYIVVFLVKLKTEAFSCVSKINQLCRRFGHVMEVLRTDMGTVENSAEFLSQCHSINFERNMRGIEINPANVEMQQQNPVERYIQTFDNMEAAILVGQDLLRASFWGMASLTVAKTMNYTTNSLTPDSTPMMKFEDKHTNVAIQFKQGFGQAVICKKTGPVSKSPGTTRNEFGVVVLPGHHLNGSVMVYFPARGEQYLSLRYHLRPIQLSVKKQMSLEDGKQYLPVRGEDGSIYLTTRGDSGILGKQYLQSHDDDNIETTRTSDNGDLCTSFFDSSILADEVFTKLTEKGVFDKPDDNLEEFAEVQSDVTTGELQFSDGNQVISHDKEASIPEILDHSSPFRRPMRSTVGQTPLRYQNNLVTLAYQAFVTPLLSVGARLLSSEKCAPDISPLMVVAAVSHDEYVRRNPKWRKASTGTDSAAWFKADQEERDKHFNPERPTLEEVQGGNLGVPFGVPIWGLKRHCKIKSDGRYKIRWVVLGNLDNYKGDTYSPTAGKKVVWLMFALSVLMGLCRRFFDITGAFLAEKPTRDVYVSLDGKVYKLLKSFYGLKDAAKVFNDGLVAHLKLGGYLQSAWDRCLFYKWTSSFCFLYIVFHVDDFFATGTSESMIDEFDEHMSQKYEVTSNMDGVFLGIHMCLQQDGSYCFRKPHQLQAIFDMYLPNGPSMSLPSDPMSLAYSKSFDIEDSPACNATSFRSMLGAIMQLTDCRPDISFTIAKIAQRQCSARDKDLSALMYLVHYLWATKEKGVVLRPSDQASGATFIKLRGYSDCSYACHGNGKSHYCYCFDLVDASESMMGTNPLKKIYNTGMFFFKSFMAPTLDLSSCQGETSTVVELTKDTIFYRGVLKELHQEQVQPTELYCDNNSTIMLATQYSGSHKRIRYMLPKINWLLEQTKAQVCKLIRLRTEELPPDVGTKNGRGSLFMDKRNRVMGM